MLFTFVIFNTYRVLNCWFCLFKACTSVAVFKVPPFTTSIDFHSSHIKRIHADKLTLPCHIQNLNEL